jgi:hypothetical protein
MTRQLDRHVIMVELLAGRAIHCKSSLGIALSDNIIFLLAVGFSLLSLMQIDFYNLKL